MRKILYATDFSENSLTAFVYALHLAKKSDAELIMLHIFDVPTTWNYAYTADAFEMEREAIRESETKLKQIFEKYAKGEHKQVKVKYLAIENISVNKGIISVIEDRKPDLLVVGTRGGSRTHEIVAGSTTKLLVKQSPCPVLAIPENTVYQDINKIVYASDFYEDDIKAIQQLFGIIKAYSPVINIVHINTHREYKGDEKMEWFKDLAKEKIAYDKMDFHLVLGENINKTLNNFINQNEIDLLVMLEKTRTGIIDKLFHNDHVQKMEFHTSTPVLVYNQQYLESYKGEGMDANEVQK